MVLNLIILLILFNFVNDFLILHIFAINETLTNKFFNRRKIGCFYLLVIK